MNTIQLDYKQKSVTSTSTAPVSDQHPLHAKILEDTTIPDLAEMCHSTFAGDKKSLKAIVNTWRKTNWNSWQHMLSIIEKRYNLNLHK